MTIRSTISVLFERFQMTFGRDQESSETLSLPCRKNISYLPNIPVRYSHRCLQPEHTSLLEMRWPAQVMETGESTPPLRTPRGSASATCRLTLWVNTDRSKTCATVTSVSSCCLGLLTYTHPHCATHLGGGGRGPHGLVAEQVVRCSRLPESDVVVSPRHDALL